MTLGMTAAVALGFLLTAMLFIFEYTKHAPAQVSTGQLERSALLRSTREMALLDARGACIFIGHLQGHLLFGSVNGVLDQLRQHKRSLQSLGQPLVAVLLDFDRCTAVDATAISVLTQASCPRACPHHIIITPSPHHHHIITRRTQSRRLSHRARASSATA